MSWSTERTGTQAAVRAAVHADLTKAAANYDGQQEGRDILGARDSILTAIDGLKCDEFANGVRVSASGSCSPGFSSYLRIEVTRVALTLDAPPAAATPAP